MIPGFERIVEERILSAQRKGAFNCLEGRGRPLVFADDRHIPEDLRLAYKILKNADCLPAEIELKKEIERTEDLLAAMTDTRERYRAMRKINYLIMRLNMMRKGSIALDMPPHYEQKLSARVAGRRCGGD
ncbi:MAG TPA: DUF1992 domain-containing protein [Desulfobacteraceae bacterium]|nr:DUF1992 domain-containing protein [Deltaproteobacteria bacterium]RLB97027.1 MAG: DUF1992 domain-containing protein [Deltaproteobacteria bacterium]HDI59740.1 DUF1992 domain-containing protein [Desulfobacteraceae bacterium]